VVRAAGARVLLNPAPARPLPPSILDRVGVLIVNRPELGALAGVSPPAEPAALEPLARKFQSDVVVTLGPDGALIVPAAGGRAVHIPAPGADIRDATGAGDCFCGVLAALLAEGAELTEAARHAVAAATLSATAVGARGKLPGRAEAGALAAGLTPRFLSPQ
jgi:ribokinase